MPNTQQSSWYWKRYALVVCWMTERQNHQWSKGMTDWMTNWTTDWMNDKLSNWLNEWINKWLKLVTSIQLDDLKILPTMIKDESTKYRILTWKNKVFGEIKNNWIWLFSKVQFFSPTINDGTGGNILMENITHYSLTLPSNCTSLPPSIIIQDLLDSAGLGVSIRVRWHHGQTMCLGLWEQLGESTGSPRSFTASFLKTKNLPWNRPPLSPGWAHPVFPETLISSKAWLDSVRGIWCLHTLFISHGTHSSFRSSGILPVDVWTFCCISYGAS